LADAHEPHNPTDPPSFEQALSRLERVVKRLEEGDLGLAEALAEYEQGVQMLKQCHALLEKAERRIELLTGVDADGNPILQPFPDRPDAPVDASGGGSAAGGSRGKGPDTRERKAPRKKRAPEHPETPPRTEEAPGSVSQGSDFDVDAPGSLF
jgi:exodeoxyribonuclease VII small subunit